MNCKPLLFTVRRAPVFSFIFVLGSISHVLGANVTLAWDPNTEPDLAGYRLYYATGQDVDPVRVDVGKVTTYTLAGLAEGVTYSIVATAYNLAGLESAPSNEISYTIPAQSANATPTIGAVANRTVVEDTVMGPVSFTVNDVDDDPATLTVTASSSNTALVAQAGLALGGSGTSRTVTATPVANASGTTTITLTVSDGQASALRIFTLTVTPVNDAPTLSALADQAIAVGAVLGPVAFTVGDVDNAATTLTVTASSSNTALVAQTGLALGGSGSSRTITATPTPNATGTTTITLTVNDGQQTTSRGFTLTVTAANRAPTISAVANQTVAEDTAMGPVTFTISDAETAATSLAVTASSSNTALVPQAGLTLGGSGSSRTITATPAANGSGTTTITLTASDGQLTAARAFTLTVTAVNDAPTISAVADQTIAEDGTMGPVSFTVGDVETAPTSLTVTASSSNTALVPQTGLTLGGSGASRTLTVKPAANASGTATITLTVSDGQVSSTRSFALTVTAANDAPAIGAIADRTIAEDSVMGPVAFTVSDVDTGLAALVLTARSSNTALVPQTGLVVGGSATDRTVTATPLANANGSTTITLTVSDGQYTGTRSFTLTVSAVNDPPTISSIPSQTTAEGVPVGPIPFTIGDVDNSPDNLTVTATSSDTVLVPSSGLTLQGTGSVRSLTITPAANLTGVASITIRVSDGTAQTAQVLTVNVVESLPAPWAAEDVGEPSLSGSSMWQQGRFTIVGGGADIAGTSDQFHFVWQPLSGDGQITARIASIQAASGWAKAGIMVRETLAANSRNAFLCLTADNGYRFQRRSDTGMSTTSTSGGAMNSVPNNWVRLVRWGNWFTAYRSADGVTWSQIGSLYRLSMASQIYIGLAVTGRSELDTAAATFDNVTVAP